MITRGMNKIRKDLKEVDPLLIVTVGKFATSEMIMMSIGENFIDIVGTLIGCDWTGKWLVPIIHPAAVARNPEFKKLFKDCIWTVAEVLKEIRKTIVEEQR
jgi:uracil-DNA glycosylase